MIGSIFGDIIGSIFEWHNVKTEDFPLFCRESHCTDDTIMTIAVANKLLNDRENNISYFNDKKNYAMWYKQYYFRYPQAGFGQMFSEWAKTSNIYIQRSYGNGAAMRIAPIAYSSEDIKDVLRQVKLSCFYTHHNREAILGAKAIASAVFLARKGAEKREIKEFIQKKFHYDLNFSLNQIRQNYVFDSRTRYCVPPAIAAFLESDSYESAIRKAISIGGDSDTIACMTGGIAQAFYKKIPHEIVEECMGRLDGGLRQVVLKFCEEFQVKY